jgi:hypothetical protein
MDVNTNNTDSWEQLPDESALAYEAFCIYRDMGPTRSLAKAAQAMERPPGYKQQLGEWSAKYEWQSRCRDYDRYMQKVAQLAKEEAIRQMTNRQARDAVRIQEMVMEALENASLEAAPPRDLIRVWERAVRAERTSRGLPAEPTRQANYVDYSDAVIDHYLDHESDRKKKEQTAKIDDMIASTWEPTPIMNDDGE